MRDIYHQVKYLQEQIQDEWVVEMQEFRIKQTGV